MLCYRFSHLALLSSTLCLALSVASVANAECESCQNGGVTSSALSSGSVVDGGTYVEGGGCGPSGCGAVGCGAAGCGDANFCGRPAPQYPVPYATPRPTVATHYTYPPLMPHHSLPHYRNIYSYKHNDGLSRTNVHWHPNYPVATFKYIHHIFELPR